MAYNPSLYMPYGQQSYPMPQYQQALQPFDLIIAVSGRNGAEAFQMPPNSRAVLFDDSDDVMYRVSTDGAGYKTVTEFDFTPRNVASGHEEPPDGGYATKADIEALMAEINALKHPAASKTTRTVSRKAAADGE